MAKAVFLDRDGVVNRDSGYVGSVAAFEFLPGVPNALARIRRSGYLTVLVTNQSGIARGLYTEADFIKTTQYMQQLLSLHDARFDWIAFCPHHPEARLPRYRLSCGCRKPAPGMILAAARRLGISLERSYMIGDRRSDLQAGARAGVGQLVLIGAAGSAGEFPGACCAPSLAEFVRECAGFGARPPRKSLRTAL